MAPFLALFMEERGRQSWGGTCGVRDVKQLGPISETWFATLPEWEDWERGIFHTRAASTGAVTLPNQHPFEFDYNIPSKENPTEETWVRYVNGIHNGIITNHDELNRKHGRNFDVDSMHIYAHLVARMNPSELQGWGALAWYEYTPEVPDGELKLLRFNSDNLHIARLETGELVFASTSESIRRAAVIAGAVVKHYIKVEEEKVYTIREVDGVDTAFCSAKHLRFGTRGNYSTGTNTYCGHSYTGPTTFPRNTENFQTVGKEARDKGKCAMRTCAEKVRLTRRQNLICDECMQTVVKDWLQKKEYSHRVSV